MDPHRLRGHGLLCGDTPHLAQINAMVERFFSSLKQELFSPSTFKTRQKAKLALFEHREVFYHRKCRHSALGYLSPAEYERAAEVKKPAA